MCTEGVVPGYIGVLEVGYTDVRSDVLPPSPLPLRWKLKFLYDLQCI